MQEEYNRIAGWINQVEKQKGLPKISRFPQREIYQIEVLAIRLAIFSRSSLNRLTQREETFLRNRVKRLQLP